MISFAVYNLEDGKIVRRGSVPYEMAEQATEGEEVFYNCPSTATHIIDNAPTTIVEAPTLDQLKVRKWSEVKLARDNEEKSGFLYKGSVLDSDEEALRRISIAVQAAQAAPDGFSINWTCQDGSVLVLSKTDLVLMPITMAQRGDSIHQKYRNLKKRIEEASSPEEVTSISW